MLWNEYLEKRKLYRQNWLDLKNSFSGDTGKFLNKSYIVIAYGENFSRQMDFELGEVQSITINNTDFFARDRHSESLFSLSAEYRKLKDSDSEAKNEIVKKMKAVKTDSLTVVAHRVELRFPMTSMQHIRQIKQSEYCDKGSTDMGDISIRVVLRT